MTTHPGLRKQLLGAFVIFSAAVLSHALALRNSFVHDDFRLIVNNEFIAHGRNALVLLAPRDIFKPRPIVCGARPATVLSLMLDRALWGLRPAGFLLTNNALHGLNSVLVYILVMVLAGGANYPVALIAALLFGLHPVQAEAVDIASFRADLLATTFYLSGLIFFVRRRWLPALSCLVLALLSKETAVTLPAAFLLSGWLSHYKGARLQAPAACFGLLMAAAFFFFFWPQRVSYALYRALFLNIAGGISPLSSFSAYASVIMLTVLHYLKSMLWPLDLSLEYQLVLTRTFFHPQTFLFLAALGSWATIFLTAKDRLLRFGLGLFALAYLPISNLIPLVNTVSDRYMYLPMAGACLAAAAGLCRLWGLGPGSDRNRRAGVLAAAALLILCGVLTLRDQARFRTPLSLYAAAVQVTPASARARYHLALAHMEAKDYAAAIGEFEHALRLEPLYQHVEIWHLLGVCREKTGDKQAAKRLYFNAILASPRKETLNNLANLLHIEGKDASAARLLEQSVAMAPDPISYNNLGSYYAGQRDLGRAIVCFNRAVELAPRYKDAWRNLLRAYKDAGDQAGLAKGRHRMALEFPGREA
jgi:tetratricopeptide (TPR) repeat protein